MHCEHHCMPSGIRPGWVGCHVVHSLARFRLGSAAIGAHRALWCQGGRRRPRLAQRQITSLAEPGRAGDADLGRLDPTVPRMRSCAALANGVIVALGPTHIGDRGYGLSMAPPVGVLARRCDGVRSNLRPGAVLRGAQSMKGWATPLHSRGSTTPLMATSETIRQPIR